MGTWELSQDLLSGIVGWLTYSCVYQWQENIRLSFNEIVMNSYLRVVDICEVISLFALR